MSLRSVDFANWNSTVCGCGCGCVGGGTYVTNMIVVMSVAVVCMWCNLKG